MSDSTDSAEVMWRPSSERVRAANLTRFTAFLRARGELPAGRDDVLLSYALLHEWSITHREKFWRAVAAYSGVIAESLDESRCVGLDRMAPPDAQARPAVVRGCTPQLRGEPSPLC